MAKSNAARAPLPPPSKVITAPEGSEALNPRSGQKVTIACKVPNGIVMRVFVESEKTIAAPGGPRTIKEWDPQIDEATGNPIEVRLLGPAAPVGKVAKGLVAGGYALTHNVNADFARTWFEQNARSELVTKRLVFMAPTKDAAVGMSKDNKAVRSNLEPLDPARVAGPGGRDVPKDPRWPKGRRGVKVETATEDDE